MRLIDADKLKEDLICFYPEGVPMGIASETLFKQILHDIDNAPTVNLTDGIVLPDGVLYSPKLFNGCAKCDANERCFDAFCSHAIYCNGYGGDQKKEK